MPKRSTPPRGTANSRTSSALKACRLSFLRQDLSPEKRPRVNPGVINVKTKKNARRLPYKKLKTGSDPGLQSGKKTRRSILKEFRARKNPAPTKKTALKAPLNIWKASPGPGKLPISCGIKALIQIFPRVKKYSNAYWMTLSLDGKRFGKIWRLLRLWQTIFMPINQTPA